MHTGSPRLLLIIRTSTCQMVIALLFMSASLSHAKPPIDFLKSRKHTIPALPDSTSANWYGLNFGIGSNSFSGQDLEEKTETGDAFMGGAYYIHWFNKYIAFQGSVNLSFKRGTQNLEYTGIDEETNRLSFRAYSTRVWHLTFVEIPLMVHIGAPEGPDSLNFFWEIGPSVSIKIHQQSDDRTRIESIYNAPESFTPGDYSWAHTELGFTIGAGLDVPVRGGRLSGQLRFTAGVESYGAESSSDAHTYVVSFLMGYRLPFRSP